MDYAGHANDPSRLCGSRKRNPLPGLRLAEDTGLIPHPYPEPPAMARTRAQKQTKPEPEPDVEAVETTPEGHDSMGGSPMSKAQAVRNALAEGVEDIGDIEGFVKSRYGIDIPRQMISAYKAMEKKRAEKAAGKPGRKTRGAESSGSAPRATRSSGLESDLLDAMEAMKPLVEKLGPEKVKRIVDLLGK